MNARTFIIEVIHAIHVEIGNDQLFEKTTLVVILKDCDLTAEYEPGLVRPALQAALDHLVEDHGIAHGLDLAGLGRVGPEYVAALLVRGASGTKGRRRRRKIVWRRNKGRQLDLICGTAEFLRNLFPLPKEPPSVIPVKAVGATAARVREAVRWGELMADPDIVLALAEGLREAPEHERQVVLERIRFLATSLEEKPALGEFMGLAQEAYVTGATGRWCN